MGVVKAVGREGRGEWESLAFRATIPPDRRIMMDSR